MHICDGKLAFNLAYSMCMVWCTSIILDTVLVVGGIYNNAVHLTMHLNFLLQWKIIEHTELAWISDSIQLSRKAVYSCLNKLHWVLDSQIHRYSMHTSHLLVSSPPIFSMFTYLIHIQTLKCFGCGKEAEHLQSWDIHYSVNIARCNAMIYRDN